MSSRALSGRAFFALALLTLLAACGGGGGGGGGSVSPKLPGTLATPSPTPTPETDAATVSVGPTPSSAQLANLALNSTVGGLVQFPQTTGGSATLTVTLSAAPLPGTPTLQALHRKPAAIGGQNVAGLLYFSVATSATVSFPGPPSFSIADPADTAPTLSYVAFYDPTNASAGWTTISGPPQVISNTLTFDSSARPITVTAGQPLLFAVFTVSAALPTPTPTPTPTPSPTPRAVYIANPNASTIVPAGTNSGAVTVYSVFESQPYLPFVPQGVLSFAPSAMLPEAVALDAAGNIYVLNVNVQGANSTISVFAPYAGGSSTVTPQAVISDANLNQPSALAVDASGKIYVANFGGHDVLVYPAHPTGNLTEAPLAVIGGGSTTLQEPTGVAVDAAGKVYVSDIETNAIDVFAASPSGSVTSAPIATLAGSNTGITAPGGVALDGQGRIYVTNTQNAQRVTMYAANPSGATNVAPLTSWTFDLTSVGAIAVDSAGYVFAANFFGGMIVIYPPYPQTSGGGLIVGADVPEPGGIAVR
ncbi:MAG TPA: NHL repeat-containing protein [Candidatus Sulfotelmatobacter sp.]|nr:NHL repeat-containing protein [Candidatus Sulfotelmatobacter sp.]